MFHYSSYIYFYPMIGWLNEQIEFNKFYVKEIENMGLATILINDYWLINSSMMIKSD